MNKRCAHSAQVDKSEESTINFPNLTRLLTLLTSIDLFILGAWLMYEDTTASASAATVFTFSFLSLFMANLDSIKHFKGFGLEAKTRNLKQTIIEAEDTLKRLQDILNSLNSLSLEMSDLHEKTLDAEKA